MLKLRSLLLLPLLLLVTVAPRAVVQGAAAQDAVASQEPSTASDTAAFDPVTGLVREMSELRLPPMDLVDGWLELTPLGSQGLAQSPALLMDLPDRAIDEGELRWVPGVSDGAAMLCSGGRSWAVLCEQVYIQGEVWVTPEEPTEIEVRFETGIAVTGRYLLESWPLVGARVAVVPTGLSNARAFTMPLGLSAEASGPPSAQREVVSDADGRFDLPPLAAGEYFLETVLPSGRVHRGEPFQLPAREVARLQTGASASSVVVWDLGEIDVADGLVVAFAVTDLAGEPLPGARVAVRQGATPETLVRFETATDLRGEARLGGFSVEESVHISCRMPGYRIWRREESLLPVFVACALEPLAAVAGEVTSLDGSPILDAVVAVTLQAATTEVGEVQLGEVQLAGNSEDSSMSSRSQGVDSVGTYALGELPAGDYRLTAAAPGFEVAATRFNLAPGQQLILEPIVLREGLELTGKIIDADSRQPIAGVEIRAVSPPGAVSATSDDEGLFTFATRADEPLVLGLNAPEHVRREVTLDVPRRAVREPFLFEMERGGRIHAVVWDEATDLPCQSCELRIEPSSTELATDGFGQALSDPLAPGDYRVYRPRILHRGSAVISEERAEYRSVRVRRDTTSEVRFGERQEKVRVVFQPVPGPGWKLSIQNSSRFERFAAQPDGSFLVGRPPGEAVELYLHHYDSVARAETEVRQTTLPPTLAASELVLPLRGALLTGRGVSEGAPIAGERVRLMTLEREVFATARTRPDGTFTIPHVPAGVYAVMIGYVNVQFVSLRAGQAFDLGTVELIAGGY